MITFGNRIEPITDMYLIDEMKNLTFRKEQATCHGKVIEFNAPWEGLGSTGTSVVQNGKEIKCYYRGYPTKGGDQNTNQTACLAISEDGIHFSRVPVNRIDYNGIAENNIVYKGTECHNFCPFYDTNPDCPEDQRYKAVGGTNQIGGLFGFISADGIHWKKVSDKPIITAGDFDTMNMAFWNPHTGRYHAYCRYLDHRLGDPRMPHGCRAIHSCTSLDFLNWTEFTDNEYAEGMPTEQFYTNAARPIPGAEHVLLSMPMRFQETRTKLDDHSHPGLSDAVLLTSRDGVYWDRMLKDAFLAGDLEPHEWTQRNFIVCGGLAAVDDRFFFYVQKNYMWEDCGIFAYSVPKYRFLSLYADASGGQFTTKPLQFVSDDVYLNYATSAYGNIEITVADEKGQTVFSSGEIFGNELSHRVHIDGLAGKSGTMTVSLKEAHLYALGSAMM